MTLAPPGSSFAFGESPFRVKGVLYLGTRGFFNENLQGGIEALAGDIAEPELRDFILQPFLASGWYDVLPVPPLIAYEARALRMSLDDYLLYRTRYQARRDLGGVYAFALRLARPASVAPRLLSIMSRMFDFVKVETTKEESGSMEAVFHGVPAILERWLHVGLTVYSETALKLAGAATVDVIQPSPIGEGDVSGVRVVGLPIRLQWT
ncbi:MAG: hypothetical protein HOW73_38310 [Polyangiaceae bacterium]|nr:hypothetical protein [Polyangiaceae bacterium]